VSGGGERQRWCKRRPSPNPLPTEEWGEGIDARGSPSIIEKTLPAWMQALPLTWCCRLLIVPLL